MMTTDDRHHIAELVRLADQHLVEELSVCDPERAALFRGALKAAWILFQRAPEGPVEDFLLDELDEYIYDVIRLEAPEPLVFTDPLPDSDDLDDDDDDDPLDLDVRRIHPWREGIST